MECQRRKIRGIFAVRLTIRHAVIMAVLPGMLLPAFIAAIVLAWAFYSDKVDSEIAASLNHSAEVIALGAGESLWAVDRESANALIDAVMADPAIVSIEILDNRLGAFASREVPARNSGALHTVEHQIQRQDKNIGLVRITASDMPLRHSLFNQLLIIFATLGLQLAVSIVLVLFVLHRRIGAPLRHLSREAASLARGELDRKIQPARHDEIGQVEQQLEYTRQSLQGLFGALEDKHRVLESDLVERIRVETALRDREQRLRALVDQSPLAIIEFDLDWHILDWNDAAVRIFGWTHDEVLNKEAFRLLPALAADSPEEFAHHFDQTARAGHKPLICRRADQSRIVCQWYNSFIRDANGVSQRIVAMIEDITERQRSDDEIHRLATMLQLTSNLVVLTDAGGHIEWFNQPFGELYSTPEGNPRTMPLGLVLAGETDTNGANPHAREINDAIAGGHHIAGLELPAHHPAENRRVWLSLDLQPLSLDGITPQQWVGVLSDVTTRRAIGEALRAIARIGADMPLRSFLEYLLGILAEGAGAQAAYLALHYGDTLEVQTAIAPDGWRLGCRTCRLQDSLGSRASPEGSLIIDTEIAAMIAHDAILAGCPTPQTVLVEAITDAGHHMLGHIAMLFESPLRYVSGTQSLIALGSARAATEIQRHNTLLALQYSEQKFYSLFQYSPISLALLRAEDGVCLDVNPAFLDHFGYLREDIVGRPATTTPFYADMGERNAIRARLDQGETVSNAKIRLRMASGDVRDCQVHVRPIVTQNDKWLLVAVVDISDMLHAQHQIEELNTSLEQRVADRTHALATTNSQLEHTLDHLRRTQDELVRSEKLAALGSLVAGIAHELNTPIGNSLLVASTLREATEGFRDNIAHGLRRSSLDEYVDEATTATDILLRNLSRAGELITNFKQVAVDQTSSQRRKFDLSEVAGEIVVTMYPRLRRTSHEVENRIPAGIVMDSYPGPLGQILANLLNNALIHAFEGRENGQICLSATPDGDDHILLCCSDDGVGISAANLKRIFDPFFTTRHGPEGTGLGLNIVHNIATGILGGEVHVDSSPGHGSTFTLRLPLIAPLTEEIAQIETSAAMIAPGLSA